MKSFLKVIAIVAAIVLLSAILAPIIFPFLPYKFERVFNRLVMIGSLIAVVCFVRIRRETLERLGLIWHGKQSLYFLIEAFVAGVVTLGVLSAVKIYLGQGVWAPQVFSALSITLKVLELIATGLLIGVVEEFFFRGFVFTSFRNNLGWGVVASVIVTNVFYSLLHFVSFEKPFIGPEPTFFDSLKLVAMPFAAILKLPSFWPAALGLFLFGVVLNLLLINSKSLYPSIGLHAGCVFFIKLDGLFTNFSNDSVLLLSSSKMYDGVLGWIFLLGMGGLLARGLKRRVA